MLSYSSDALHAFFKYITKLKYDEKPDYDKYRREFSNALKALGKSNIGDLEFKIASSSSSVAKKPTSTVTSKESKRSAVVQSTKSNNDMENISPKQKNSRKRNNSSDRRVEPVSPIKKIRNGTGSKSSTQRKPSTQLVNATESPIDSSIHVNNHVGGKTGAKSKTYHLNFELDISFDANVVVNVKRKSKKAPKPATKTLDDSIQSTDEIPSSEKTIIVKTAKVIKKGVRTSPRNK